MICPSQRRQVSALGLRPSFGFRVSAFGFPPLPSCLAVALASHPAPLLACAACAGQSDSAMAQGMNWGIFSLLGVIGVVLGGVASFFVYLGKRSAAVAAATAQTNSGRAGALASLGLPRDLPGLESVGALTLPNRAVPLVESGNRA